MNIALENDKKRKFFETIDCQAQGAIADELEAACKWIQVCNPKIKPGQMDGYVKGFSQGFSKGVQIALQMVAKA